MPFYTSNFTPMDETAQRNAEWQRQWLAMVLGQQGDGGGGGGGMPGGGMLQQILAMVGAKPGPSQMSWQMAPGTYTPWAIEGQWQPPPDAANTTDQFVPPWAMNPMGTW